MADELNPYAPVSDNPYSAYMDIPSAILGESPQAAYYSYSDEWGAPNQQRYYQNQFQNIYNEYLGSLGGMLRQGVIPDEGETFAGYLSSNYGMGTDTTSPWNERYTSLPTQMRGEYSSMFNPRTREIYF